MTKLEQLINKLCPNGVKYKRFDVIMKSLHKKTLKRDQLKEKGKYPVVNSGQELYGYYDSYNNDGDAIAIASRGEYAGFVHYMKDKFWAGGLCYPFTSIDKSVVNVKFVYYYLKTLEKKIRDSTVLGGSMPALNRSDVDKIEIPIPPLFIQKDIVDFLDNLTFLSSSLVSELTIRKQQYEYYRNKLLTIDVIDKDVIDYVLLKDVADIKVGCHNTNEALKDEKYPFYIRSQEILHLNSYDFDDVAVITSGDGIGVGKIFHFVEGKYALHQRAYRIKVVNDMICPKFLYYYMKSNFYKYINRTAVSSSVASIRRPMLENFKIPILSLKFQHRMVEIFDVFEKICFDENDGLLAEIKIRQRQYEYYLNKLLNFKKMP